MGTADEMILSYNDVVLRPSDMDIRSRPCYFNDRIIEFYIGYLSSCYPSQDILLVLRSIAFWISNCPDSDSQEDFLGPPKLTDRKKLVIISVTDNEDLNQAEGGCHWRLLVFESNGELFVHYGSYGGMNRSHARQLNKAVAELVDFPSDGKYVEQAVGSPQKVDGYECGLSVTVIARIICSCFDNKGSGCKNGYWFSQLKERSVHLLCCRDEKKKILELEDLWTCTDFVMFIQINTEEMLD